VCNYNKDFKQFWLNTKLVPNSKPDTQLPLLINTLKRELDMSRIDSVLEVGIGYGRIAAALLDCFVTDYNRDDIVYVGLDISQKALKQSMAHLNGKNGRPCYFPYCADFGSENIGLREKYDLVISVETMSVIPDEETVQKWISKMVSLSKQYVVNLDHHDDSDSNVFFNIGHSYSDKYLMTNNTYSISQFGIPDYKNEVIHIVRVK
jgi:SAM-dependent methyltransferase